MFGKPTKSRGGESAYLRSPVRGFLILAIAIMIAAGVAACGGSTANTTSSSRASSTTAVQTGGTQRFKGITLKVANCCGPWNTATAAGVDKRFEKLTGAKVAYTEAYAEQLAPQVIAAHGHNPPYDVVFLDDTVQTELAKLGLIDRSAPSTLKDAGLPALNPGYSPGAWLYYVGFAYNYKKFQQLGIPAPTSWADLWNPKLAGRIEIPSLSTPQGFQAVAAAAAVAGKSQYDLSAGVDQLAKLKLYNVYSSSSQYQTDLSNGNAWIAVSTDGRAWALQDAKDPINYVVPTVPGTGKKGYVSREFVDVTTGSQHEQLAKIYQSLASDATTEVAASRGVPYEPMLPSARSQYIAASPKWGHRWPPLPSVRQNYLELDWSKIFPLEQATTARFSREIH